MSDFTPRANLRLPGGGSTGTILPDEQVDIDVLNDNFRKIDALLGARNIPSASSYAGSMDGDLVYAQDTEFLHMFSTTAGGLITPRLPGSKMFSGTRAEREAFTGARDGDMWRDTNNIGIIWAYKAGSPGTWEYSGNKCRGTKADILQTDTDGIAVPGMIAFCTDDNSDYVRLTTKWRRGVSGLVPMVPELVENTGGSQSVNDRGVVTFDSITSLRLKNIFTEDFANYRMLYQVHAVGGTALANYRFRFAKLGVADASASYYSAGININGSGATTNAGSPSAIQYAPIGGGYPSWSPTDGSIDIKNPKVAGRRSFIGGMGVGAIGTNFGAYLLNTTFNKDDSVDGFEFYSASGGISGTLQVFGYAD